MTPDQIQGWLQIGVGGLLLLALFAGFKRVWVWGWMYAEMQRDRDEWKAIALRALPVVDKAVTVAAEKAGTDA